MTEQVSGVVEKVNMRFAPAGSGKKWSQKSMLVNGEWFGAFINKDNKHILEPLKEGDLVEVSYVTSGKFKNVENVKLVAAHVPEPGNGKDTGTADQQMTASIGRMNDKDRRITYLASRKDAIEFLNMARELEAVKLPTKMADRADALLEYVREYTDIFLADAYGENKDVEIPKEADVSDSHGE